MSEILNRLKQAEAERERVIAERKRLEAEADAALDAVERETRGPAPRSEPAPRPSTPAVARLLPWGWAAAAVIFLAVTAFLLPEREKTPAAKVPSAEAKRSFGLKLDRDLDAFAARARAAEKR